VVFPQLLDQAGGTVTKGPLSQKSYDTHVTSISALNKGKETNNKISSFAVCFNDKKKET